MASLFQSRTRQRWALLLTATAAALVPAFMLTRGALSSDHADTPEVVASPGTDLTDVYIFPSASNQNNVVLAMNVRPLIPAGQAANFSFDPEVLYQFKIDNTGDSVEDLVVQARFSGSGPSQTVAISGPVRPERTGVVTTQMPAHAGVGTINQPFSPTDGMQVFAGAREDSFFFDLEQFFVILPDRATPITGQPVANPNTPRATSWRPAGQAKDFLAGFNVLSVVVEVPRASLRGSGDGKIRVWCTTSR